jgi:hypothetical protein
VKKNLFVLVIFCLFLLTAAGPAAGLTVGDGSVTITRLANLKYFMGEDTITFSGTNTASDMTYLFITGPSLKTNGAQIQSTHPGDSPVIDDDSSTFQAAPVGSDNRWSYTWDIRNVRVDSGTFTLYAASTPRDLSHINRTRSDRVSFLMFPPKGMDLANAGAGAGSEPSETGTIAGKGYVTIVAAGNQSYFLGDEIPFSGTNTETYKTYLFITGPNLPEQGSQIHHPDPRHWPVEDNNTATFKAMDVNGDHTWSWKWGTANYALDAGVYTIYAVSKPYDKNHLENAAYGTVSIIIKRPIVPAAESPAAPVATPAPAKSPGSGALIALIGLGAVALIALLRY